MTDQETAKTPREGRLKRLLQLHGSPESIALGTAFGLFIGMTPTVGIQMIIILVVSLVIPIHRMAGLLTVYISNPLTVIPIYWLDYWVGLQCLARKGKSFDEFKSFWHQMESEAQANAEGWYQVGLELLRSIGNDVLGPLFLGGALVGLVVALPAYPLTLRMVIAYRSQSKGASGVRSTGVESAGVESAGVEEEE